MQVVIYHNTICSFSLFVTVLDSFGGVGAGVFSSTSAFHFYRFVTCLVLKLLSSKLVLLHPSNVLPTWLGYGWKMVRNGFSNPVPFSCTDKLRICVEIQLNIILTLTEAKIGLSNV